MAFCASNCPTANACMRFSQSRKSVGCELDSDVLSAEEPGHLLTVAAQLLSPSSNTTEGENGSSTVQRKSGGGFGLQKMGGPEGTFS